MDFLRVLACFVACQLACLDVDAFQLARRSFTINSEHSNLFMSEKDGGLGWNSLKDSVFDFVETVAGKDAEIDRNDQKRGGPIKTGLQPNTKKDASKDFILVGRKTSSQSPGEKLMKKYKGSPDKPRAVLKISKEPSSSPPPAALTPSSLEEDLKSKNLLTRLKAKIEMAAQEQARKRRLAESKRREQMDNAKAIVFTSMDTVKSTYETIVNLPVKIEQGARKTKGNIEEFEEKARNTIIEIQRTPEKVRKVVDDTKKQVEKTQQATMEVVEDVKAIPGRVGNTIDETKKTTAEVVEEVLAVPGKVKKTAAEVKETAENTLKGFEHFFFKGGAIIIRQGASSSKTYTPATRSRKYRGQYRNHSKNFSWCTEVDSRN